MATKAGVGFSNNTDPQQAGKEACQKAIEQVANANLVIVFASTRYDQEKMLSGVRQISGEVPLVGCSDSGEITTDGPNTEGVAVMVIESDTVKFTIGTGGNIADGPKIAGAALAKDISGKSKEKISSIMVLTDVLKGNGADVVRGVQEVMGENFVVVGGAAGDDFKFKEAFVYYLDKVLSSSAVGVGLSGNFSIGVGVRHGWTPVGLARKVTKSQGAVISEIDGKPAVNIYEEHFGKKADELKAEPLAIMAITYPLGMSVEGSDEFLIRDPITVDENGAITCAAEIPEGSEVRLMIGGKDEAIEAAKDAAQNALNQLNGKKPKAIIMFNCIARQKLLGRHAGDEIKAVQSILGSDVPLIGFYTYGELAPLGGNLDKPFSCFHNETAVLLVLGD